VRAALARRPLWVDVHGGEVFERFVDVVNDQAEVLIADRVGGLIRPWFPARKDLDVLALVPRVVHEKPASRQKLRHTSGQCVPRPLSLAPHGQNARHACYEPSPLFRSRDDYFRERSHMTD